MAERESEELRSRLARLEDQLADQKHDVRNMEAYKHQASATFTVTRVGVPGEEPTRDVSAFD